MGINSYKKYILEGVNPESVKMFYSEDLIEVFAGMNSIIAKELLNVLKKEELYPFSFVDVTEETDKVSFLPVGRLNRLEGLTQNDLVWPTSDCPAWGKQGRQVMRIAVFVRTLLPQYGGSKELENFVHEYVGKNDSKNFKLLMVEGEDIRKWYHVKNYFNESGIEEKPEDDQNDPRSVLVKSCMKQPEKQSFFDIYVKNPEQCKMLIMLNKNNKLVARAIVWVGLFIIDKKEKPPVGTFLDRIYYTNESDVNIFKDYPMKNGWIYKTQQTKDCETFIYEGKICDYPLTLRLKNHGLFPKYPYLDSLCFYTPDTGRLSSTRGQPSRNNTGARVGSTHPGESFLRLQLRKIGGGFLKLSDNK